MHKEIEKATLKITQAMEKNRKAYNEAHASYRDTGYDRYYKKMEKLNNEYAELKAFLHTEEKTEVLPGTVKELYELKGKLNSIKSTVEYILTDLPVSSEAIHLKELLMDIK